MAVVGATQLETPNILGAYVQGLEAARANKLARTKEAQELAAAARETEMRNFLANTPDLTTPEAQNQLLQFGKPGAELATSMASLGKTRVETQAAQMKLADDNYGRFQKAIGDFAYGDRPATKMDVLDSVDQMVAAGIIRPEFRQFAEQLPDDPNELQTKLRGQFLTQIPPAERAKLFIPLSPEVEAQKARIAGAGAARTTVNLPPAGKKFSETLGETAGKRLDAFRDKAESAVQTLQTSQQLQPLLDDPKFISGTFADARLALARAANIDVASTEAYFAGIGQQVAERITAFGAGTGLSDADREFAKSIAGGNPVTTAEGIRRIVRINNESARNVIKRYNDERSRLAKKEPEVEDYYPEINVARQIKRTGTVDGRRVVEYDDGSVEYAD
jgi:hypothetical protein